MVLYSLEILNELCEKHNIILNKDYSDEKINVHTRIIGNCITDGCLFTFDKRFESFKINPGLCTKCVSKKGIEKMKTTCVERYGVDSTFKLDIIKEKIGQTNLQRYGTYNPINNEHIKEKRKQTNLQKYGKDHIFNTDNFINKKKDTCLEKYGYESASQSDYVKAKMKQTNLYRYGVENVSQNKDIAYKASINMYKKKEYILPSGNIINYQGYENFAIDEIISEMKIDENDIIMGVNNVPEIWYKYNDKDRRHYVDIYIPSLNMCIEVKSTWTIDKKREQVFLKMERAKELGYIYEIWVYKENGTKVECYK
jgi:hypothetical protein